MLLYYKGRHKVQHYHNFEIVSLVLQQFCTETVNYEIFIKAEFKEFDMFSVRRNNMRHSNFKENVLSYRTLL